MKTRRERRRQEQETFWARVGLVGAVLTPVIELLKLVFG